MGKASRAKREREKMNPESKRVLKQLKRESTPEAFVMEDKMVFFNPMKKLLNGEKYKTSEGEACTREMVSKYEQFLKAKMREYKERHTNKEEN